MSSLITLLLLGLLCGIGLLLGSARGEEVFRPDISDYKVRSSPEEAAAFRRDNGGFYTLESNLVPGASLHVKLGAGDAANTRLPARKSGVAVQEIPGVHGRRAHVFSSEGMSSFVASLLGRHSEALYTDRSKPSLQSYKIAEAGKETLVEYGGIGLVACHRGHADYPVMMCHQTGATTAAYHVPLVGAGAEAKNTTAVVVCHKDTAWWHPDHLSFRLLNGVRPGMTVCHYLLDSSILWKKLL